MKKTIYEITFVNRKEAAAPIEKEIVLASDLKTVSDHYEPTYEVLSLKVIQTNTHVKVLP